MKIIWLRLLFTLFFQPALAPPADSPMAPLAPPPPQAPINAHIISTNFKHVLCWDPAPGAAPQTLYVVLTMVRGRSWREVSRSSDRCLQIKLENEVMYKLTVKTWSNTTLSPPSNIINFYPARQSQIGPPRLSLAGCGDCIQINISLPQADKGANIPDIQEYYRAPFTVLYRKKNNSRLMKLTTVDRSFILSNLEKGAEYCVQVALTTHLNRLTTPSAWTCIFSSPAPGTEMSGVVAPVLSVGILLLIVIMVILGYTGSLWRLGVPLPEALVATLPSELTLTPERPVPDPLTLQSQRRPDCPAASPVVATTYCSELEGDEEEEECIDDYMDRDPGLSSGRHLFLDGPPASEHSDPPAPPGEPAALPREPFAPIGATPAPIGATPAPPGESPPPPGHPPAPPGESSVLPREPFSRTAVTPVPSGEPPPPPGESPPPLGDPSVPPGDPPTPPAVQDLAKEGNEELQSCSSNVDLFSITLASLAVKEAYPQEEQDNYDFFREPSMKCLFSGDLRLTLIDSQSKAVESLETTRCQIAGDVTVSDCDDDETNPLLQVEEEQGLLFSEYLVHQ